MSTALTQSKNAMVSIQQMFDKNRDRLVALVGGDKQEAERLITSALMAAAQEPKLLQCDPRTLFRAVGQAAMIGADLTAGKGHGWIIPRWNSKTGKQEAVFQEGYLLWLEKMVEAGYQVTVGEVREKDKFEFNRTPLLLTHNPDPFATQEARGKHQGSYCAAYRVQSNGTRILIDAELLGVEELTKAREGAKERNKGKESPAYRDWEDRMYYRLPIKRLAHRLDVRKSPGLQKLLEVTAVAEAEANTLDVDFDEVTDGDLSPMDTLKPGKHWGFGGSPVTPPEDSEDAVAETTAEGAETPASVDPGPIHTQGAPPPGWDEES